MYYYENRVRCTQLSMACHKAINLLLEPDDLLGGSVGRLQISHVIKMYSIAANSIPKASSIYS